MKAASRHWLYGLLLLLLTALGLGIRLLNLAEKPLWTDEFSTIVFSLGNSFLSVPLDQPISTEVLLEPLRPQGAGPEAVVANLFRESNHPPLYFLLSHFWLQLFPTPPSGWVSAWTVRLLPAILGALSIPLTAQLGWLAFRSRAVAQVAAAVMAVSPFGIYLAQEARHYTLPLIWILLSLCYFVVAARHLRERQVVPISICLGWIVVNGLGIATHYFFVFTLGAEAIVLLCLGLVQSWQERGIWYPSAHWRRIWIVAAGTAAAGLIWWPVLQNIQGGELTRWIYEGNRSGLAWLEPLGQAVAGWVTMLYLLPIQADSQEVVVLSGVILVLLVLWTLPKLNRGLKVQLLQRDSRLGVMVLGAFVVSAILLFFSITYLFETDLTGAFRYNFVYFPGAVVLLGAGLASSWNVALWIAHSPAGKVSPVLLSLLRVSSRRVVLLVWLLSLLGALTVVTNLGYQKTHRPDVVAAAVQSQSQSQSQPGATVLVAIPHQTHGQTGRLMGVALALRQMANQTPNPVEPLFLLAHDTQNPRSVMATLRRTLNQLPRPLDLWLLNFQTVPNSLVEELLEQQNCEAEGKSRSVDGYRYRHYRCTEPLARPIRRPSSE